MTQLPFLHEHHTTAYTSSTSTDTSQVEESDTIERFIHLRRLQSEPIYVIKDEQSLLDAIVRGRRRIEIRTHLDLTTINAQDEAGVLQMLGNNDLVGSDSGINITGSCESEPSATELGLSSSSFFNGRKFGQCVIVTDVSLAISYHSLWLKNLYIRYRPTTRSDTTSILWCGSEDCNLWLIDVTLQGNSFNDPPNGAVEVAGGQMYAEGLVVRDFVSEQACLLFSNGATANLHGCIITVNAVSETYSNSAINSVNAVDPDFAFSQDQDTLLMLQQCNLSGNDVPYDSVASTTPPYTHFGAFIYSDVNRYVHYDAQPPRTKVSLPLAQFPDSRSAIVNKEYWIHKPAVGDEGQDVGLLVGGLVAAVLVCVAAAFCARLYKTRKSASASKQVTKECHDKAGDNKKSKEAAVKRSQAKEETPRESNPAGAAETGSDSLDHYSLQVPESASSLKPVAASAVSLLDAMPQASGLTLTSASNAATSVATLKSSTSEIQKADAQGFVTTVSEHQQSQATFPEATHVSAEFLPQAPGHTVPEPPKPAAAPQQDTFDLPYTVEILLPPPGPNAPADQRVDFLQQQLDGFGLDTPIFDDLCLLGGGDNERRQGGQAVVQMAISKRTRSEYAIKFFLSREAFNEESGLYSQGKHAKSGTFAQFLPRVLQVHSNTDSRLKDVHGNPLCPCIVMERGESLDVWAERRHPDRPQAFSMMHQLAHRLMELHALGYVHRDLKPGNVMWLPRENRWTVIDFGCVARTGEAARLGFSMAYAAPEVIAAYRSGDRTMVAQEAMDVWSLGVMAFELLTGSPAMQMMEGKDKVMDRIEGRNGLQLPWEGTMPPVVRRKLGVFKASVLKLLARDPAERPSMKEFCTSCDRVLAGSTSVQL